MRAYTIMAAVLVLGGISIPAHAQLTGPEFNSWGSCNSYLKRYRNATARGGDSYQITRWDQAYCAAAGNNYVIIFPY